MAEQASDDEGSRKVVKTKLLILIGAGILLLALYGLGFGLFPGTVWIISWFSKKGMISWYMDYFLVLRMI